MTGYQVVAEVLNLSLTAHTQWDKFPAWFLPLTDVVSWTSIREKTGLEPVRRYGFFSWRHNCAKYHSIWSHYGDSHRPAVRSEILCSWQGERQDPVIRFSSGYAVKKMLMSDGSKGWCLRGWHREPVLLLLQCQLPFTESPCLPFTFFFTISVLVSAMARSCITSLEHHIWNNQSGLWWNGCTQIKPKNNDLILLIQITVYFKT